MANIREGEWDFENQIPGFGGILAPQYMPAILTAVSAGMKGMGLWNQGQAQVDAAKRSKQAADFQARQLEVNAGQAQAAAQRDAYFKGLEGQRLISAIKARAGAGGADPTVLNIIAQAEAQRAYNVQAALYGGQDKARTMRMQAASARYQADLGMADAKAARSSYRGAAVTSLVGGAQQSYSLFQKYWADKESAPAVVSEAIAREDEDFYDYYDMGEPKNKTRPGHVTTTIGSRG